MNCPVCIQPLEGGELVMVCRGCHQALGGGLEVGATGEFRVPEPGELEAATAEDDGVGPGPATSLPAVRGACSWCGKREGTGEGDVAKLLGRNNLALCNECVALCCDILDAELGDRWR